MRCDNMWSLVFLRRIISWEKARAGRFKRVEGQGVEIVETYFSSTFARKRNEKMIGSLAPSKKSCS